MESASALLDRALKRLALYQLSHISLLGHSQGRHHATKATSKVSSLLEQNSAAGSTQGPKWDRALKNLKITPRTHKIGSPNQAMSHQLKSPRPGGSQLLSCLGGVGFFLRSWTWAIKDLSLRLDQLLDSALPEEALAQKPPIQCLSSKGSHRR